MNRIIVSVKPFILNQRIYCYNDDEIELIVKVNMNDLAETVFNIADDKKITDISIAGNKKYLEKIKNDIMENEYSKYGVRNLNIKLI